MLAYVLYLSDNHFGEEVYKHYKCRERGRKRTQPF